MKTEEGDVAEVAPHRMPPSLVQGQQRGTKESVQNLKQDETGCGRKQPEAQQHYHLPHHQVQPQQRQQQDQLQQANLHLDRDQQLQLPPRSPPASFRPISLPAQEDEQVKLALSHNQYRQQLGAQQIGDFG